MRTIVVGVLVAAALVLSGGTARGQVMPPPRPFPGSPPVYYGPPVYRPSSYEVWNYYARSQQGFFLPRAIYLPDTAFYLYNGAPFPWAYNRAPLELMPYAVGPGF